MALAFKVGENGLDCALEVSERLKLAPVELVDELALTLPGHGATGDALDSFIELAVMIADREAVGVEAYRASVTVMGGALMVAFEFTVTGWWAVEVFGVAVHGVASFCVGGPNAPLSKRARPKP